ncbi:MAG: response regulator [Myxococcus sp.]|nr:response regulator [Myxococcus sp.]
MPSPADRVSSPAVLAHLPFPVAHLSPVGEGRFRVVARSAAFDRLAAGPGAPETLEALVGAAAASVLAPRLEQCGATGERLDERLWLTFAAEARWCRVLAAPCPGGLSLTVLEERADDAELQRRLRQFESIAENSPDIIARLDRDFRHLYVNRAIVEATGATAAHFIGKDHRELGMPEELIHSWQATYRHVFETGQEGKKAFDFPTPSGVRSFVSRVVPERGPDGRIESVLSVARDVTALNQAVAERLEVERRLHQAQRLESLGILAGGIAHDFNNLLAIILNTANLARLERRVDATLEANLDQIEAATLRAAELCAQMLAYAGKGPTVLQALDLDQLVRDSSELLRATVSKRVALKVSGGALLPLVRADRTQVQQVVMNLVMNASEAVGERDGVVRVTTAVVEGAAIDLTRARCAPDVLEGPFVCVTVADDGCGMSDEVRERMFEPFFTTKFTGRGLGLAATLGIIRGHGGVLTVESAVGVGTTFKVYLPAAEGAAITSRLTPLPLPTGGGTVLVVDDEESVRSSTSRLLEECGLSTLVAADGREALALFERHGPRIGLVLLDVTMPQLDGPQTLQALRRLRPEVRVILMSGHAEADVARRVGGGQAAFLQKPFTLDLLARAMGQAAVA